MLRAARPTFASATAPRLALGLALSFLAWLVVLSHLASTLHFALISHEICADHGELVHGSAALEPHGEAHESGPAASPGDTHPGHDHCAELGRRNEHVAVLATPGLEIACVVTHSEPRVDAGTVVRPARSRLLLSAPKQSPPA